MEEDILNAEMGRKILALTKASFKVSDLIPDLVLREKIKHQVLEVYKTFLVDSRNQSFSALLKEINILERYFYFGGHLNLVKEEHLKQLQNGFLVFKSHIVLLSNNNMNKNMQMTQIETNDSENQLYASDEDFRENELSRKQKKILEKFEIKDTLRLSEIMETFSNVSERTVRNELSALVNLGKITRSGMGSGSFYKIVK